MMAPEDLTEVRDWAQALDGAGFDYATVAGHILTAPAGRYEGRPPVTYVGPFHDPFVLFSYLAGLTERIHFISGILILPLYPTALVAKQASELHYVSNGRFELGIGLSSGEDEYQALGENVHNRGRRVEEQVELLRRFWTERHVSFKGKYHTVPELGLNRPPIEIPIWMGMMAEERQLRRIARLADGWMPMTDPTEPMQALRRYLEEEGRDPATFRVMGRVALDPEGPKAWVASAAHLQAAGATHISLSAPPGTPAAEASRLVLEGRKVLSEAIG